MEKRKQEKEEIENKNKISNKIHKLNKTENGNKNYFLKIEETQEQIDIYKKLEDIIKKKKKVFKNFN
jgi:hypothetical protein